jgi:hypothetical protein
MMSSNNDNNNPHTNDAGDFEDAAATDFVDEDMSPIERGESGASLPNAEEVRATVYAENAKNTGRSSRCCSKKMMILSFVLLAAVALSVGLAVGLSNRENQETSSSSLEKIGNPTSGGKTPDADAEPAPRKSSYTDIKNYVIAQGISLEDDFGNDSDDSPQARAASWMADVDGLNLAIPTNSGSSMIAAETGITVPAMDAYRFAARYILTVLYYATNGENWKYQFNFLTDGDVCTWKGALVDSSGMSYIPFGTFCDTNGAIWGIYLGTWCGCDAFLVVSVLLLLVVVCLLGLCSL